MVLMPFLGPILARDCHFDTVAPCGENSNAVHASLIACFYEKMIFISLDLNGRLPLPVFLRRSDLYATTTIYVDVMNLVSAHIPSF